jgi:hypothetical protein
MAVSGSGSGKNSPTPKTESTEKTPPGSPKELHKAKVQAVKQAEGEDAAGPSTSKPTAKSTPLFTITTPAKIHGMKTLLDRDLARSQVGQEKEAERKARLEKEKAKEQKELERRKFKYGSNEHELTQGETSTAATSAESHENKDTPQEDSSSSHSSERSDSSAANTDQTTEASDASQTTEATETTETGDASRATQTADASQASDSPSSSPNIEPAKAEKTRYKIVDLSTPTVTATRRARSRPPSQSTTSGVSDLLKDLLGAGTKETDDSDEIDPSPKAVITFISPEEAPKPIATPKTRITRREVLQLPTQAGPSEPSALTLMLRELFPKAEDTSNGEEGDPSSKAAVRFTPPDGAPAPASTEGASSQGIPTTQPEESGLSEQFVQFINKGDREICDDNSEDLTPTLVVTSPDEAPEQPEEDKSAEATGGGSEDTRL